MEKVNDNIWIKKASECCVLGCEKFWSKECETTHGLYHFCSEHHKEVTEGFSER